MVRDIIRDNLTSVYLHTMTDKTVKKQSKQRGKGKPFKKNDPRINRKGRPKGSLSVVEAIKRKLQEETKDSTIEQKKTYLDVLITQIFKKAIAEGDVSMIKDIINRVDGLPIKKIEQMGKDGKAIRIDLGSFKDDELNERINKTKKDKISSAK